MRLSRKKEKQRKCIFKCDHLYSTYILCHKKIFRVIVLQITVLYINTFKAKNNYKFEQTTFANIS